MLKELIKEERRKGKNNKIDKKRISILELN